MDIFGGSREEMNKKNHSVTNHEILFGTDGIRGIAGKYPLTKEFIEKIGFIVTTYLLRSLKNQYKKKEILIGRDTRGSGETIFQALAAGITKAGVTVVNLGVFPTPGVAYLTKEYQTLASAVISASHNPFQFNGIKFFSVKGTKLDDRLEKQIEKKIHSNSNMTLSKIPAKTIQDFTMSDKYLSYIKSTFPKELNLNGVRLVIDCANGTNYKFASGLFSELGAEVISISNKPDGKNINLNCGSLFLNSLSEKVVKEKADLGFAFDGDGDRVLFIDSSGKELDGDFLVYLAAKYLKQKRLLANNVVVVTKMANLGLIQALARNGIRVHTVSVGDRYVWEGMVESGAMLGGEPVGHIIFSKFSTTGDGLITALQILALWRENKTLFYKWINEVKKYPQILVNVPVKNRKKLESIPQIKNIISQIKNKLANKGRVFVRYSGTEPLVRIMLEGENYDIINNYAQNIADVVKEKLS